MSSAKALIFLTQIINEHCKQRGGYHRALRYPLLVTLGCYRDFEFWVSLDYPDRFVSISRHFPLSPRTLVCLTGAYYQQDHILCKSQQTAQMFFSLFGLVFTVEHNFHTKNIRTFVTFTLAFCFYLSCVYFCTSNSHSKPVRFELKLLATLFNDWQSAKGMNSTTVSCSSRLFRHVVVIAVCAPPLAWRRHIECNTHPVRTRHTDTCAEAGWTTSSVGRPWFAKIKKVAGFHQ